MIKLKKITDFVLEESASQNWIKSHNPITFYLKDFAIKKEFVHKEGLSPKESSNHYREKGKAEYRILTNDVSVESEFRNKFFHLTKTEDEEFEYQYDEKQDLLKSSDIKFRILEYRNLPKEDWSYEHSEKFCDGELYYQRAGEDYEFNRWGDDKLLEKDKLTIDCRISSNLMSALAEDLKDKENPILVVNLKILAFQDLGPIGDSNGNFLIERRSKHIYNVMISTISIKEEYKKEEEKPEAGDKKLEAENNNLEILQNLVIYLTHYTKSLNKFYWLFSVLIFILIIVMINLLNYLEKL